LQEIYVNLPPVPPPATRDRSRPPPRPAKASIHLQQQQQQHQPEASTSQQARYHSQQHQQQQQQQPLQLQQQHFSQTDNYVGLSLIPNIVDLPAAAAATCTTPTRNVQAHNQLLVSDVLSSQHQQQQQQHHSRFHHAQQQQQQQQQQPHQSSSPARRPPTNPTTTATTNMPSTPSITQHPPTHTALSAGIDELVDYADVADSIRDYNIAVTGCTAATSGSVVDAAATSLQKQRSPSHENLLRTEPKFQKLSPEKYDQMVGNFGLGNGTGSGSGSAKAAERHMQQHADDIELYVDPCDYASLREIGLPMEEIQEMSKKLKQEQKDEVTP